MYSRILLFTLFAMAGLQLQASTVPTSISSDTTLSAALSPWTVNLNTTVQSGVTLTIEPGTVVQFANNRQMTVHGHLDADQVTFTSANANPTEGIWTAIFIEGSGEITNSIIEYADYGVSLGDGVQMTCTNTLFSNNGYPVEIRGASPQMDFTGCTYVDNGGLAIYYDRSETSAVDTFHKHELPYYIDRELEIPTGSVVRAMPGAMFKFASNDGIRVNGALRADGTAAEPIIFTSIHDDNVGGDFGGDGNAIAPGPQSWRSIIFAPSSVDSLCLVDHVEIKFSGQNDFWGGLHISSASPTISNTTFTSNEYGVYILGNSAPLLSANTFQSSQVVPVAMQLSSEPIFDDVNRNVFSFSDNEFDAIGLIGGAQLSSATIEQRNIDGFDNVTYVLLGSAVIDTSATITIDPGIVIKAGQSTYLRVGGELIVNGTSTDKVIFTSINDDNHGRPMDTNKNGNATSPVNGNWGGIIFMENSSSSSLINHAEIDYGRTVFRYFRQSGFPDQNVLGSGIAVERSNPTLTNLRIANCDYGITCYEDAAPTISDVEIVNTVNTPIAVTADADPIISNVTTTNVGLLAMGLIANYVFFDGNISQVDLAGFTNITYVLTNREMVITSDARITVDAGVVIKSETPFFIEQSIRVEGGLKIAGTASEPVVFTSIRDDQYGNPMDTNGDGNATSPSAGDWHGIQYSGTADDAFNSWDHFVIAYAGSRNDAGSGLLFSGANASISDGIFIRCHRAMGFDGDASPVISDVTINSSTSDPLIMSVLADPSFSNITFNSNAFNTIAILDQVLASDAVLAPRAVAGFDPISYRQVFRAFEIRPDVRFEMRPGVVWKMKRASSMLTAQITVLGGLKAVGTSTQPVVITADADDAAGGDSNADGGSTSPFAGYIDGVYFYPSSIDSYNELKHVEVRYGSRRGTNALNNPNGTTNGSVAIRDAFVDIADCTFAFAGTNGLGIYGTANPSVVNCNFENISRAPIELAMFSSPTFSGNSVANCGWIGLDVAPETYSQDATVPKRDFAGYTNITYTAFAHSTIGTGTTITIPEGVVFKNTSTGVVGDNILVVRGRLQAVGTVSEPIVFADIDDDSAGHPADSRQNGASQRGLPSRLGALRFEPVADDQSRLEHVRFGRTNYAVRLFSASPSITNCDFSDNWLSLDLQGNSAPEVGNCTFSDGRYVPIMTSIISYPDTTYDNVISGSTWKAIGLRGETLNQDFTLTKRAFGGIDNIPYLIESDLTIGTGAVLTIGQGVVMKFNSITADLIVNNGLIAEGGPNPGESIVFTSMNDDVYGGDTRGDGQVGRSSGAWQGINFNNSSIDADCRLEHVVIRHAREAIGCSNASPSITKSFIQVNDFGIEASGASNPVIDSCHFDFMSNRAVGNSNPGITIKAENCFWGDCSGPTHSSNPSGIGQVVTDYVDFDPWLCESPVPAAGDVSRNGSTTPFDASLILQHLANVITLDAQQISVGDVSGTAGLSAFDASLILQRSVGLIDGFPVEQNRRSPWDFIPSEVELTIANAEASAGDIIDIPVHLSNVEGVQSLDAVLHFDETLFEFVELTFAESLDDQALNLHAEEAGSLRLLTATSGLIEGDQQWATLRLKVKDDVPMTVGMIEIDAFITNETDLTDLASDGLVRINGFSSTNNTDAASITFYPNPFNSTMTVDLGSDVPAEMRVQMTDMSGRTVSVARPISGSQFILTDLDRVAPGVYILSVEGRETSWQTKVVRQ